METLEIIKNAEKSRGYTYKMAYALAAKCLRVANLIPYKTI